MRVVAMPVGTGGVAFYRMNQPYGWLQKQGHEIFIFDGNIHDGERLKNEIRMADVIVYQCPWSELIRDSVRLIKEGRKFGRNKKVVAEFDDNLFAVSPWNEKYHLFGTEEIKIEYSDKEAQQAIEKEDFDWVRKTKKDGKAYYDMWRDGYKDFDIERNLKKLQASQAVIGEADLVTTTTMELGKAFRKMRPKEPIAILPNLIDFDRWLPMKKNESDEIRIGWYGGSAHFHDLAMIADELKVLLKKNPKVKLIFMGIAFNSLFKDMPGRVEWMSWHGDIATHPLMVRNMKIDIGLCPLMDDKFNRGKSPLKWEELSVMKVPAVVSPVVYGTEVTHGKTGLIAKKGEWVKAIESLIEDPVLRTNMAQRAHNRVKLKFGVERAQMWWDALTDLCYGKTQPEMRVSLN